MPSTSAHVCGRLQRSPTVATCRDLNFDNLKVGLSYAYRI